MKIKKGDTVKVISGASRGKVGKVLKVISGSSRVTVEGVNLKIKHAKARKAGQKGQKIEFPASLHISNVAVSCPKCGKATRVAMIVKEGEKKIRACKRCGQSIE